RGSGVESADARRLEGRSLPCLFTNVLSLRQARIRNRSYGAAAATAAGTPRDGQLVARGTRRLLVFCSPGRAGAAHSGTPLFGRGRMASADLCAARRVAGARPRPGALRRPVQSQSAGRVSGVRAPTRVGRVLFRAVAGAAFPRSLQSRSVAQPIETITARRRSVRLPARREV